MAVSKKAVSKKSVAQSEHCFALADEAVLTKKPSKDFPEALIIPVFEEKKFAASGTLKALDTHSQGMIARQLADNSFTGSKSAVCSVAYPFGEKGLKLLLIVGLGPQSRYSPSKIERAMVKAVAQASGLEGLKTIGVLLPAATPCFDADLVLTTVVDACTQATYKSQEATKPAQYFSVTLYTEKALLKAADSMLPTAKTIAQARVFAKHLTNKPANLKSTQTMAQAAQSLAKLKGITVTVEAKTAWISKNMPCFYEVAKGSVASDPPKWITVKYQGAGVRKNAPNVALVGKSVIFDTGGYQVKPDNYMVTMKGDMTGGAVVLGVMKALGELQPKGITVTAYLAATPNKIDSMAMTPDTIVGTTCGTQVEIRHTDAEGRLTLIDAVAMAAKAKPSHLLTIATLTGSASSAVGLSIALLAQSGHAPSRQWRDCVHQAALAHGEPVQTLDVLEDDFDDIKSKLDGADIINTTQRKGRGAQSAAAFVMTGAGGLDLDLPFAHLDIAGADMTPDEKATGIGVKTLLQTLLSLAG